MISTFPHEYDAEIPVGDHIVTNMVNVETDVDSTLPVCHKPLIALNISRHFRLAISKILLQKHNYSNSVR